jgi:undecaprenyl-diphosphatase
MEIFEPFDEWADAQLERLRGNKIADAVFTTASEVGDFSLIWQIVSAARGLAGGQENEAFIFSALLGAESLVVNQGIKRLFGRIRPTEVGDPRYPVRKPSTSSFPSGHASSAFFAAVLLSTWSSGRRQGAAAPLWFGLAGIVATSRAYVRIHHASDVVVGAAVGLALGVAARKIVTALR